MPAEVETMFFVREEPWHRLGVRVEEVLTATDALVKAGLNWRVSLCPLLVDLTPGQGEIEDHYGVVRSTDNSVLGIVGKQYTPIQNEDAFAFFDTVVGNGDAKYETAGSLRGGRRVFMTAKLPQVYKAVGEEIAPYVVLSTGHDGWHPLTMAVTPIRVVCMNTLNLALGNAQRSWRVLHTRNYRDHVEQAQRGLGLAERYFANLVEEAERLAAQRFEERDMVALAEEILADAQRSQRDLVTVWHSSPNLANIRQTKWGALNAVAEYIDWMKRFNSPDCFGETVLWGSGLKDAALALLGS